MVISTARMICFPLDTMVTTRSAFYLLPNNASDIRQVTAGVNRIREFLGFVVEHSLRIGVASNLLDKNHKTVWLAPSNLQDDETVP